MTSIALFGAGGKMGARLTRNLMGSPFEVRHVEVSEAGRARLRDELGITCLGVDDALTGVDVVILAVPDTLIGRIAAEISPKLAAGTLVSSMLNKRLTACLLQAAPIPDEAEREALARNAVSTFLDGVRAG